MGSEDLALQLRAAVVEGNDADAGRLAQEALAAGLDPMALVHDAIQDALNQVGGEFEAGYVFLPELILAGDAASAALKVISPRLLASGSGTGVKSKVVIGTIQGDLHDIGKNVVAALLTAHGLEVVDLGTDVSPRRYVQAAKAEGANIIAISTLLTTGLPFHREVIRLLEDTGCRQDFFVVVGGGPVNADWAEQIGADGYGRDANNAVTLCKTLATGDLKPPLSKPICVGVLKGAA